MADKSDEEFEREQPLDKYLRLIASASRYITAGRFDKAKIVLQRYFNLRRKNEESLRRDVEMDYEYDRGTMHYLWDSRNISIEDSTILTGMVEELNTKMSNNQQNI